jgi:transaldolase
MILHNLNAANLNSELWWDSLPDTRDYWRTKLTTDAVGECRERIESELRVFFDGDPQSCGGMKGATTNPNLVWESISIHADYWKRFVVQAAETAGIRANALRPDDLESIYWLLYRALYVSNAASLLPTWESSCGRYGWVCAQVLPCSMDDAEAMIRQGTELASLSPNLMIKVPATEAGFQAIEALTGRGISVNSTLSFTVSQAAYAASAVRRGLEAARVRGLDLAHTRAVATFMAGRLGTEQELRRQAEAAGLALTPIDLRRIEILVFQGILRLLPPSGAPMKPLLSSLKLDNFDGELRCLHLEQSAGTHCIYTFPPAFLGRFLASDSHEFGAEGGRAQPAGLSTDALLSIPYVREAYEADSMAEGVCAVHPAYLTGRAFTTAAYDKTLRFIDSCLETGKHPRRA